MSAISAKRLQVVTASVAGVAVIIILCVLCAQKLQIPREAVPSVAGGAGGVAGKWGFVGVEELREMVEILALWSLVMLKNRDVVHSAAGEYFECTVDQHRLVIVDYATSSLTEISAKIPDSYVFVLGDGPEEVVIAAKMLKENCSAVVGMDTEIDGSTVTVLKCSSGRSMGMIKYVIKKN